jgi:hypothetical protein
MMISAFVAEDETIVAITSDLPDRQNLPEWLRTLEATYSQVAGVPLPVWEEMKKRAALLFLNACTKQMIEMNAVDALQLYRLIDLYKEDLEAIVYGQLEGDSEV